QLLSNNTETEKDFRKALELEDARREGREIPRYAFWPRALMYSERVRYTEQLRRFHAVLPREQVLVLIYEDFRADNAATLRRVLRFLDLDDDCSIDVPHVNPSRRLRWTGLSHFMRRLRYRHSPALSAINTSVKALVPRRARKAVLWPAYRRLAYGEPRAPDDRLMNELRHRFKPEVEAVSEYLQRDLVTLWGYDRLD